MPLLDDVMKNRSNYRIYGNTSSIAEQKFVPYTIQDENKNLDTKGLYDKHVKEGEEECCHKTHGKKKKNIDELKSL